MRPRTLFCLVAVGVLVAASALVAGQDGLEPEQEETGPDLVVTEVRITGPEPFWNESTPKDTTIEATVENRGDQASSAYTLRYAWRSGTNQTPMNEDNASSFDTRSGLASGAQATHTAEWRLQENQVGQGALIATVETQADTNETNNTHTHPIFIPKHLVRLEGPSQALSVYPDTTTFYRFAVVNEGNVPASVETSLWNTTGDNRSRFAETVTPSLVFVEPGEQENTTVFLRFPFEGDDEPFQTRYTFHAETRYGAKLNASTPDVTAHYDPPSEAPFSVQREGSGTVFASPELAVPITLTLGNEGQARDVYQLEHTAPNWQITTHTTQWGLGPGEQTGIQLEASPQPDASSGSSQTLEATFTSELTGNKKTVTIPLQVTGFAGDVHRVQPLVSNLYTNETASFEVQLRNVGNEPTPNATLLTSTFTVPDAPERVQTRTLEAIPPGGEANATFTWNLTTPGTARLETEWTTPDGSGLIDTGEWTGWIHNATINLTAPDPGQGVPGQTVRYTNPPQAFTAKNEGDRTETIRLSATTAEGDAVLLESNRITLPAGAERVIPLHHRLPNTLPTLDVPVALTAELATRDRLAWTVNTSTHIEDSNPPTIRYDPQPATEWVPDQPFTVRANVTDETLLETVNAHLTSPTGDDTNISLVPDGQAWVATLTLDEAGNHTLQLTAVDAFGNEGHTPPHTVQADPLGADEVRILSPSPDATVPPGASVELAFDASVGWVFAQLEVRTLDGELVDQHRLSLDDGTAEYALSNVGEGPRVVEVTAITANETEAFATLPLTIDSEESTSTAQPSEETNQTPEENTSTSQAPAPSLGPVFLLFVVGVSAVWQRARHA